MFKTFNDFVVLREFGNMQPQPNAPANKQNLQDTLAAAMKAPPPPGTNPQAYRQKLMAAMQAAKNAPVKSPQQAVDLVNVQNQAGQ